MQKNVIFRKNDPSGHQNETNDRPFAALPVICMYLCDTYVSSYLCTYTLLHTRLFYKNISKNIEDENIQKIKNIRDSRQVGSYATIPIIQEY